MLVDWLVEIAVASFAAARRKNCRYARSNVDRQSGGAAARPGQLCARDECFSNARAGRRDSKGTATPRGAAASAQRMAVWYSRRRAGAVKSAREGERLLGFAETRMWAEDSARTNTGEQGSKDTLVAGPLGLA